MNTCAVVIQAGIGYATSWILESYRCHHYRSSTDRVGTGDMPEAYGEEYRKWIRSWCRNTVCVRTMVLAIAVAFGNSCSDLFLFTPVLSDQEGTTKPNILLISFRGDCIFFHVYRGHWRPELAQHLSLCFGHCFIFSDAAEIEDVKNQFWTILVGKQNNGKNYFFSHSILFPPYDNGIEAVVLRYENRKVH